MRILLLVFVCCFAAVCAEAPAVLEVSGHVGGEVSILCSDTWATNSSSDQDNMYFCKGVCSGENILIQTERTRLHIVRRGRYSMQVHRGDGGFNVTIKRLKSADAGTYHCGVEKTFNVSHQQINLKVVDASTVPLGSPPFTSTPSTTTLLTEAEFLPQSSFASGTEPSAAVLNPPATESKINLPAASKLTDTGVVIIVSVSLAILVCAIIPLIFYGRCQSYADAQKKEESNYCEETADVASQTVVSLQSLEPDAESSMHDVSQYAAVYQALDPKTLE